MGGLGIFQAVGGLLGAVGGAVDYQAKLDEYNRQAGILSQQKTIMNTQAENAQSLLKTKYGIQASNISKKRQDISIDTATKLDSADVKARDNLSMLVAQGASKGVSGNLALRIANASKIQSEIQMTNLDVKRARADATLVREQANASKLTTEQLTNLQQEQLLKSNLYDTQITDLQDKGTFDLFDMLGATGVGALNGALGGGKLGGALGAKA